MLLFQVQDETIAEKTEEVAADLIRKDDVIDPEPVGETSAGISSTATTSSEDDFQRNYYSRDVGLLLQQKNMISEMSAEERYQWAKTPWMPPVNYKFPVIAEGKKNRSFQKKWFESYPWLVYSDILNGGLCKVCILHGSREGGTNNVKLGKLVLEPLKLYKKAIETLNHHSNTDYHKRNVAKNADFVRVMEGKSEDVLVSMHHA